MRGFQRRLNRLPGEEDQNGQTEVSEQSDTQKRDQRCQRSMISLTNESEEPDQCRYICKDDGAEREDLKNEQKTA